MQRPGSYKKRHACPGLDAPDQKECSFPLKKRLSPCGAEEEFPHQREVWRPENSWEEEEGALGTPTSPGDTQGSSESHCSQGRSPTPASTLQASGSCSPIFLPADVLSLVPAFQTLLRGARGGCPKKNIPTAASLKSIKAGFYTGWLHPLFFYTPTHKTLRSGKVALRRRESSMTGRGVGGGGSGYS